MVSICPYSLGLDIATGAVDFDTHTFKVMLLTASYTPDKTDAKRSDLSNEVSGTGYTAAGEAITVTGVTRSTGTTSVAWSSVTWAGADSFSARYAAIYRSRGGAASADEVVAIIDFSGGAVTAAGGNFVLSIPTPLQIVVP